MHESNTIAGLLRNAESALKQTPSARLDAELLLTSVLKKNRAYLYSHSEDFVSEPNTNCFLKLIEKRKAQYPLAYLTGIREFWSMDLRVNCNTLIPRPETECMIDAALDRVSETGKVSILDLGTGSGAIALAIAKERPDSQVIAVDCSSEALKVAEINAKNNSVGNITFIQSDWFDSLSGMVFDLILSNPPYVESNYSGFSDDAIRYEPRLALDGGKDGLDLIRTIIPAARRFMKRNACIFIEHGHSQGARVENLFQKNGYGNIRCCKDYAKHDRFTFAQWLREEQ